MKSFKDFAKSKSAFVSVKDGESYTGIYQGYKFIEKDVKGETKEYARYLLEDLQDNVVRNLDSQSGSLATQMDKIPKGSLVKISKTGEGFDTKWKVESPDMPDNKEKIEEMPDEEEIPVIEDSEISSIEKE